EGNDRPRRARRPRDAHRRCPLHSRRAHQRCPRADDDRRRQGRLPAAAMTKRRPVAATAIVALLAAAATTIVALRYGSRVAGGSDSYGYVSQAQLWREHSFLVRDPIFAASPWPFALETWTPLGYAPGPHRDGIVPAYPPGLPLVMAALQLVGGYCSAFLVTPIAAGVCVLATYLLGARVLGRRAPA